MSYSAANRCEKAANSLSISVIIRKLNTTTEPYEGFWQEFEDIAKSLLGMSCSSEPWSTNHPSGYWEINSCHLWSNCLSVSIGLWPLCKWLPYQNYMDKYNHILEILKLVNDSYYFSKGWLPNATDIIFYTIGKNN